MLGVLQAVPERLQHAAVGRQLDLLLRQRHQPLQEPDNGGGSEAAPGVSCVLQGRHQDPEQGHLLGRRCRRMRHRLRRPHRQYHLCSDLEQVSTSSITD